MAKPKFPKKSNDAKQSISTQDAQPPVSNTDTGAPEVAAAAIPPTATKKTESRKAAKKPEIVKTEPRANLVPINLDDEIRRLAYLFSERRGFESGHETEDWLNAEREVLQRYHQQSA